MKVMCAKNYDSLSDGNVWRFHENHHQKTKESLILPKNLSLIVFLGWLKNYDSIMISKEFVSYQTKLKQMLSWFDTFCRENKIKYTALDGTLLGAVRHRDMIPWDGDVDVALTPKELEKLKKAFANYNGRYHLNYFPNHFYKRRGRKHNFATMTSKIIDKNCNSDIFGIDVFTIDFLGDDYEYAKNTIKLYKKHVNRLRITTSFHIPEGKMTMKRMIAIAFYPLFKLQSLLFHSFVEKSYIKFREKRIDCNSENCKYFTIEPYLNRFGVEINDFLKEGYIDIPFGNMKVMVASGYEIYLKGTYGDYMKLPPEEKRVPYPSEDILLECKWM